MPRSLPIVTESYLRSVNLPQATATYTVISHGFIIDTIRTELNRLGLVVQNENYSIADGGDIAMGRLHIKYENDPELGLMFTWINSYNKKIKFGCSIGAMNTKNLAYYIPGNVASWNRKHNGTADQEAELNIINQISLADTYYKRVVSDRDQFKSFIMTDEHRGSLLGSLFFEKEILQPYQATGLVKNLKDPLMPGKETLWDIYTHINIVLGKSHPLDYIDAHISAHDTVKDFYNKNVKPEYAEDNLPGQLKLFEATPDLVSTEEVNQFYEL
jgi:hypothetical protein